MKVIQEIWKPDIVMNTKLYQDSITIYDGGDFVGYALQKANQPLLWKGFHVLKSNTLDSGLEKILLPANSFTVPFEFFAKETYPAQIKDSQVWIPQWVLHWLPLQLDESVASDFPWLPQEEPQNQEQILPSVPRPLSSPLSSSQPPLIQSFERPKQSLHPSQNRNNSATKPRVLPSSNPTFHERPKQSIPGKPARSPLQPSQVGHIVPLPQQEMHLTPSPSPHPRGGRAIQGQQSTSSSLRHSNSKSHLPSQRVPHQFANNLQHPTSAKQPSHGQIARVPESPF